MNALAAARDLRDRIPEPAIAAFLRFAERRFGLAACRWNSLAVRKRLLDLMARGAGLDEGAIDFVARLEAAPDDSGLHVAAADVLPNGETSFFRDVDQLREVAQVLVPAAATRSDRTAPIRVLSAGCSSGEEVYSLAMLLFEASFTRWGASVEVVGVDLRERAIEQARLGTYFASDLRRCASAPPGWDRRFFRIAEDTDVALARPFLKQLCRFEVGDLLRPGTVEALGTFDVVLCRNVLIHLERAAALAALQTLRGLLAPEGRLVLSHAEAPLAQSATEVTPS